MNDLGAYVIALASEPWAKTLTLAITCNLGLNISHVYSL